MSKKFVLGQDIYWITELKSCFYYGGTVASPTCESDPEDDHDY